MAPKKVTRALTGSGLHGADQSVASWAGLEVPADKWNAYVAIVGSGRAMARFFERIRSGRVEVTDEGYGLGPNRRDACWAVTTDDVEALRAEVRARLVEALGLRAVETPKAVKVAAVPKKKAAKTARR